MARLQKKLGSPQKTESMNKHGITHSPIFVILPDKDTLFAKRAQRFAHLAKSIPNKEFLLFFAHFCNAQQHSIEKFKDFAVPLSRFGTTSTPFFDRSKLLALGLYNSIVRDFLNSLSTSTFSNQAFSAIRHKAINSTQQKEDQWRLWGENLLNSLLPQQQLAEHIFIIGTLQIMYSLAASQLDAQSLSLQPNNLCPACSGTHTSSIIIGKKTHETLRVCSCLYCSTLWHIPHTQCTFCQAKQKVSICTVENTPDGILFEACETCGQYCKQLNSHKNPTIDVFADDIGTPTPDFLHQGSSHFKHGNFNPFLQYKR
ncbi:formate dehydrogenase accessory protein FdhE [Bartonella quintana]|uniref:formate dehydrogenase accessory protein FdhE n=1 Tax=Bartonella quintana TaxID=803 RepID=UPI00027FCD4A|nr:formate dehydrogenase accessory protein FdhE [Bartonella quintana]AFR26719.1 hypothetical protein RM11_1019 [Bartonella quintana RM-11]